jgi:hypothetical protein
MWLVEQAKGGNLPAWLPVLTLCNGSASVGEQVLRSLMLVCDIEKENGR